MADKSLAAWKGAVSTGAYVTGDSGQDFGNSYYSMYLLACQSCVAARFTELLQMTIISIMGTLSMQQQSLATSIPLGFPQIRTGSIHWLET